jgi:3-ketosteroid 9alpha-monooxygenase subunit A
VSRFPFPMPFGWFKVAMSDEVGAGDVLTKKYFGTELVLWRDADGAVTCQEAYCAHLGAHLGVGGTIDGSCIRCPFHGWAFDREGVNVDIPYADRPNRRATLRSFPVQESAGLVTAWYHPHGEPPKWDLIEIPEYDDPAYLPYEVFDFEIATCIQELSENAFDHAHFQFVHSHPRVGLTEKVELSGFDKVVLTSQEFPSSKGPVKGRIDVFGRGPGFAITRYSGLLDASLIGCSTPIDKDRVHLSFHFTLRNPERSPKLERIGEAFVQSVTSEVQQDIPIWEAKRYVETPSLAPSEGPIMEFRRWFRQFYADPVG